MVSILVPVRDEERVVGRLLDALLRLDYPQGKREILIVEDGSGDETVGICAEYARRYPDQIRLFHKSTSNGKPSALNYALQYVRGEIVAVFDADNVPEPDALTRAVGYFKDSSIAAVQGRTCSINADENMLTKFISYEEAVYYETFIRGKDALSLFVPLSGNCQFVRRSVLERVGGWDEDSLSEDMEMAVKLTVRGYTIKYAPDVRSWQESPANLSQLMSQRTRWYRGCMEVGLRYGKLVTKLSRKNIDTEFTLVSPYMFPLWLLGYIMAIYAFLVPIQHHPVVMVVTQVTSVFTMILSLIAGIALIYVTKPRRITNVLWLPFVYMYWSVQTFIAIYALAQIILKRPRSWTKTMKTGAVMKISVAR